MNETQKTKDIKFFDLLICPECLQGNLIRGANKIECNICNRVAMIKPHSETIIFSQVYEPKEKSVYQFTPKNNKRPKNWRELNFEEIKKWLETFEKDKLVLDLGCGRLTNSYLLEKYTCIYIDGADFDNVNIVCDFERRLPLKDQSVDRILLSNVLEHIYDPKMLFSEIYRVLKDDGECMALIPFAIQHHQEPFDFNRYTRYYLERTTREAGFHKIYIKDLGSLSNIMESLLRLDANNINNQFSYSFSIAKNLRNFIKKINFLFYRVVRYFSLDEDPNSLLPQGFMLRIRKN